MVKARTGPRALWHIVRVPVPAHVRAGLGGQVYANCGLELDYDVNTMSRRLEVAGINRATSGECCPHCGWLADRRDQIGS
jgi:hypothetical protein